MSTDKDKNIFVGGSFKQVWERISAETDVKYLKDLANIVGVTQQNVSSRKQENLFPYGWAYLVGKKYNLLTEWIMTGERPKRLEEGRYSFPILQDLDQWLIELVVNEPERRPWFGLAVQDAFPMFKQWKKRKEDNSREDNSAEDSKVA